MGLSQGVRQDVSRRIGQYEGRVKHFCLDTLGLVAIGMVCGVLLGCSGAAQTEVDSLTPTFNDSAVMGWVAGGPGQGEPLRLHHELELESGDLIELESCDEVRALDPDSVLPVGFRYLRRAQIDCLAVALFASADASRTSHLGGRHLTEDLLRRLPASSKPPLSLSEHPPEAHAVGLVDKEEVDSMDARADGSFVLPGSRSLYVVQALAWGDFNADGVEDVMIRIDWKPSDGFGEASTVVVLTGDRQDGVLRLVSRVGG